MRTAFLIAILAGLMAVTFCSPDPPRTVTDQNTGVCGEHVSMDNVACQTYEE